MPIARLCYKFGPRLVIGVCGFLGGLGYILMSQLSAVWQMYLLYGVLMSFSMGAYISVLPIVARWFVRRRGLMTGIVFTGMGIGMMVVPPVVSQLIATYGWRFLPDYRGYRGSGGDRGGGAISRRDPQKMGLLPYGQTRQTGSSRGGGRFFLREALRTLQFWLVSACTLSFWSAIPWSRCTL